MKRLYFLLFMLSLSCVSMFASENDVMKNYYVTNETEFIKAIGSSRVITLAAGTTFNLSNAMKDLVSCTSLGIKSISVESMSEYKKITTPCLRYNDTFDGFELLLFNFKKMTIRTDPKDYTNPATIVVDPRYAYTLSFMNCKDIKIENVILGHTEGGYCTGGVLQFYNCNKVVVDTSKLFGCGTEGLNLCETKGFSCYATEIYDCTYYIMTMSNSENVLFKNCSFHDNREFSLINSHENLNVKFSTCSFWDNYGTLISSSGDPMEFHDCEIKHPLNQLGDWLKNLNYDTIIEE